MTNKEFDEILEKTNAVVCNREWYERAAKALEQQPNDDCVSRQAVLARINDWWGITSTSGEPSICDYIRELPPVAPTQRWIPCSERLPKEDEVVLGTNSSNDLFETNTWNDCGEIKWYANGCFDVPVIAWMPLPKQYKADMESNACKDCYYNDGEVHAECVVCGAEMESEE